LEQALWRLCFPGVGEQARQAKILPATWKDRAAVMILLYRLGKRELSSLFACDQQRRLGPLDEPASSRCVRTLQARPFRIGA
jgi:hypothetical protein